MADQGSPTSETSPQSQQCMTGQPILVSGNCDKTNYSSVHFSKLDNRPNSSQFGNLASVRTNLPPSPPMSTETSFEGYHSPSSKPTNQSQGSSNYYYEATPPLSQHEADSRQMATAAPRAPVQPPTFQTQYPSPAGYSGQSGVSPYYPPMQPTPPPQQQMPGLYYQRPLPQVRRISQTQREESYINISFRLSPLLCPCQSQSHQLRGPTLGNITTISPLLPLRRSRSLRTGTSARPVTRPSLGLAHCESTATRTLARSLSSAPMLDAEKHSASAAT